MTKKPINYSYNCKPYAKKKLHLY